MSLLKQLVLVAVVVALADARVNHTTNRRLGRKPMQMPDDNLTPCEGACVDAFVATDTECNADAELCTVGCVVEFDELCESLPSGSEENIECLTDYAICLSGCQSSLNTCEGEAIDALAVCVALCDL